MSKKNAPPVVVGWREIVALPAWDIPGVKAKVDTGARTSAIHVGEIEELPDGRVRFEVVVREKPRLRTRTVEARPVRKAIVKPSHGRVQERWVCRTTVRIGPIEREVELSLVCRKGMLCRMLVGRRALPDNVLVDPGRKYLHGGVRLKKKTSPEPEGENP